MDATDIESVGVSAVHTLLCAKREHDRRLTMRHLVGVDSDGEVYHQPSARLLLEHRRVGIDAEAARISSPVYRLQCGVRIGG